MRDGAELEKRAVVLDGGRLVAALVGDDGEVVVRPALRGIDGEARRSRSRASAMRPAAFCTSARLTSDSTLRGSAASATRNSAAAASGRFGRMKATPRLLCAFTYFGSIADRALELLDRIVQLAAILVEQPEIVVHLGARVVLLEQRAVVRERVVEVADALVVQRQAEVIVAAPATVGVAGSGRRRLGGAGGGGCAGDGEAGPRTATLALAREAASAGPRRARRCGGAGRAHGRR